MQLEDRWDDAADLLLAEGRALERAGAELGAAVHQLHAQGRPGLEAGLSVPFLHLADVVGTAATAAACGASGCWDGRDAPRAVYADRLARHGLDVVVPTRRASSASTARSSTSCAGACCRRDAGGPARVIAGWSRRRGRRGARVHRAGAAAGPSDSPVPLLPTARLHVEAGVDAPSRPSRRVARAAAGSVGSLAPWPGSVPQVPPATFAEVVGQEHVTEPLSTALAAGRINHAYLFSGRAAAARPPARASWPARSTACRAPPRRPCGVCSSCVSLAPGGPGNIDVTELDAASHGGVDDTRELRDRAFFAPAESRYRVFIVDEAHMITTQGFNALLKIVEEPPEHLVFVFATTEPDKVLTTIRSRTHHYPFRLIPPGTLRGLLERICADEGAVVAPAVYPLVIRAGGGSARDSLSILDQLLAGAGEEGVTYERAVSLLGVTDVTLIDDVVDALGVGDRAAVFEAVDRLVEAGHDPRRFAADLLQRLRDLTLLQSVPEAATRGLVEASADEVSRMIEQAGRLDAATLTRYGEILHTGLTEMRGATRPRLLLELLCARMLLPAATTADGGLLERLERLERRSAIEPGPASLGDPAGDGDGAEARRTFRRRSGGEPAGGNAVTCPSRRATAARASRAPRSRGGGPASAPPRPVRPPPPILGTTVRRPTSPRGPPTRSRPAAPRDPPRSRPCAVPEPGPERPPNPPPRRHRPHRSTPPPSAASGRRSSPPPAREPQHRGDARQRHRPRPGR
jgi:DNA polymerase-3 subunit gamma/tau